MPGGLRRCQVTSSAPTPAKPRRFFGSVEIDMNRPVKAFDAIISAVVMELQRSRDGATAQPRRKGQADPGNRSRSPLGFNDADVGVVRDNTKQLKFTPGSTGFEGSTAHHRSRKRLRYSHLT